MVRIHKEDEVISVKSTMKMLLTFTFYVIK